MSRPLLNPNIDRLADSNHSEYICIGDKLIFREGRTKGLGVIKELGYDKVKNPLSKGDKNDAEGSTSTTSTSTATTTASASASAAPAATGTAKS